jgi:signal transduction histidine kinase
VDTLLPVPGRLRWWIAVDCLAAVVVGVAQFELVVPSRELAPIRAALPLWLLLLFAVAMAVPVAVRRWWPVSALAVMLALSSAMVAAGIPAASGPALPVALTLFSVARACPRRTALAALGITLVVLTADALASRLLGLVWNIAAVFNVTLVVIAAWCAAFAVRQQRERIADRRAQAVGHAVAQERLSIARELHDVVAHGMSVIAVQSGFGRRVFDARPEAARGALDAIHATSRESLAELRHMLGVLRQDGPDPYRASPVAPSPGLNDLDALRERISDAGVHTVLRVTGRHRPLPPGLDLAAFRIMQEALTNVVKHSGTGSCQITLDFRDDDLRIEIIDHGSPPATAEAGSTGHGLIGMRERVAVYDGDFTAAPLPGRGFRVSVRLPIPVNAA